MDAIGWFLATIHGLLGHQGASRYLGITPGDPRHCSLCQYERDPSPTNRRKVFSALTAPKPVFALGRMRHLDLLALYWRLHDQRGRPHYELQVGQLSKEALVGMMVRQAGRAPAR
jgi:hypothetical protein